MAKDEIPQKKTDADPSSNMQKKTVQTTETINVGKYLKESNSSKDVRSKDTIDASKKTEKPTNVQTKRIDRITSIDDNIGPKSNVLNLVEKNIKNKDLTPDNLNEELHKIKDLYASFDGAKMTSTLINLDIEEMCFCLSCAVSKHIEYFLNNVCTADYLDFVRQKIFHSKETTSQSNTGPTKGDAGMGINNPYMQPGMNYDKRQIMSEVNQTQLIDQVSKQEEAALQAQKKKKKMLFDEETSIPQMTQKYEEASKLQEDSYSKDVSQNYQINPMDYVDNDSFDQPTRGATSNRYGGVDEEEEVEEEDAKSQEAEEDAETEEDFEREISSDEPSQPRQQGLGTIKEQSKEQAGADYEKGEPESDPAANEKIENFLRESLMYSMVSSLQGSHLRGLPQKEQKFNADSQRLLALAGQDEDIEEDDNDDQPSHNDRPEDTLDSTLGFSIVSQYTAVDDLDSSQLDQNYIARVIFERTFNDKRWNEQDYFKSKKCSLQ